MKTLAAILLTLTMLVALSAIAQEAPDEIVFESKMGNVTFDHKAHTAAAKDDCEACHDKLFPQSREPINFKDKMHKTAEAEKTSCAGCHHNGGTSFETKGNCKKCHIK
jgi:c(7)-type cytochrome triheme protein